MIQQIIPTNEIIIGEWVGSSGRPKISFTKEGTFSYEDDSWGGNKREFIIGYNGDWRIQNGKLEVLPHIKKHAIRNFGPMPLFTTDYTEEKIVNPEWIHLDSFILEESGYQYFLKFNSNEITTLNDDTHVLEARRLKLSP